MNRTYQLTYNDKHPAATRCGQADSGELFMALSRFYQVIAISLFVAACGPAPADSRVEESEGGNENAEVVSESSDSDSTCGELFGHGCEWQYVGSSMDPSIEPHYVCGWRALPGDSARATEGATPPACGPHCCDEPMPQLPE